MSVLPELCMRPCDPDLEPRASLLLLHGYGEHAGRYQRFQDFFASQGYDVWFYDQRNHGTSVGNSARSERFKATVDVRKLLDDHLELRRQVEQRSRSEHIVFFGHSMGGLITAASALVRPQGASAVALSGPAFLQNPSIPRALAKGVQPLARLFPRMPVASLNPESVAHDSRVVANYRQDPLNYKGRVPLLTGSTMALVGHETLANAQCWKGDLPLVIMHGDDDQLADVQGSRDFMNAIPSGAPHELWEVPGGYHEILQEPDAEQLHERLASWLRTVLD